MVNVKEIVLERVNSLRILIVILSCNIIFLSIRCLNRLYLYIILYIFGKIFYILYYIVFRNVFILWNFKVYDSVWV